MKDVVPNQQQSPANPAEPPEQEPIAVPQIVQQQPVEITNTVNEKPEEKKKMTSLVHYSSGSEDSEEEEQGEVAKVPPEETKLVIEKMASYVAKNGSNFESIVRSKGDPRFDFLTDGHVYYGYYKEKIAEFSGEKVGAKVEPKPTVNGNAKLKDKKVIGESRLVLSRITVYNFYRFF